MKVFVVSGSAERRAAFEQRNRRQPLRFGHLAAVDLDRLDRDRLRRTGLLARDEAGFDDRQLGRAFSHAMAWRNCAGGREPLLVLEDDAGLRGDFWRHAKPMLERYLSSCDLLTFGYEATGTVAVLGSDGIVSAMRFDEAWQDPGTDFDEFPQLHDARPGLFRCLQFWGLFAYCITPSGARSLLSRCLPLSSREDVRILGEERVVRPDGLDGMINLALQKGRIHALACYPALAKRWGRFAHGSAADAGGASADKSRARAESCA